MILVLIHDLHYALCNEIKGYLTIHPTARLFVAVKSVLQRAGLSSLQMECFQVV